MKTYQEAVWKLALTHARHEMGGGMRHYVDGLDTVAWLFEVSEQRVQKDVDKVFEEAWRVSGKTWEEGWAAMPVINTPKV
jgi:hypothetical protein